MKYRLTKIFLGALLLGACTNEEANFEGISSTKVVDMNLSISTLAVNDPVAVNQDQMFGSLAIYLFNNDATFTLDKSALLPAFTSVSSMDIPFQGMPGDKIIYLVANYVGKTFKRTNGTPITLSPTTTKQQLDDIITETSTGFSPSSLLMIGKQAMTIAPNDNGRVIGVLLHRLQARVDLHIYKGPNFGSNAIVLQSVKLNNQILNSDVDFDFAVNAPQMLTSPMYSTQTVSNIVPLAPYVSGTILDPAVVHARFYSYQNLVTVLSPIQITTPYMEIVVNVNGTPQTYKGYFTDTNQLLNKYSLLQNNVYQILAVLDADSKLTLNMHILPWNKTVIEYERPITANDFTFTAWGTSWGGINGKTVHSNVGAIEDAVFQFELKAPFGAAWTATLTNGLDFAFPSSTAGTGIVPVSKGVTNIGAPYLIAVRALKRWTGVSRDTEFYITVEGNEVPINPIIGTQRKYEGTDTRIKIRQVASSN